MGFNVRFEQAREIEINGKLYEVALSDFEVYAIGKEALRRCNEMDTNSAESVSACIAWLCDQIERALRSKVGAPVMRTITSGAPVTLEGALAVVNYIAAVCGKGYAERVNEYIQPDK